VTKANVPGLTIQKYKDYRQNMPELIKKVEDVMTIEEGGSYGNAIFRIQKIKMPMMMTNRSVPVLLHTKEEGNTFISVGSSQGTEACIADNQKIIGKDVVANMIISYQKLVENGDSCSWTSVQCLDIAGSIPDMLKKKGATKQI